MSTSVPTPLAQTWGFWGAIAGALGLLVVFIQIGAPMMEPQPSVGSQIGEIAGDMKRAAWDRFLGREPAPVEPAAPTLSTYLVFVAPALGIFALLASMISGIRRENWRLTYYSAGLGGAAIVFHFFWWAMLMVLGVMLLISIIENLGSFFDGGLFGG